jgi:hypothetical protein
MHDLFATQRVEQTLATTLAALLLVERRYVGRRHRSVDWTLLFGQQREQERELVFVRALVVD